MSFRVTAVKRSSWVAAAQQLFVEGFQGGFEAAGEQGGHVEQLPHGRTSAGDAA